MALADTIEKRIARGFSPQVQQEFAQACQDVFATPAGHTVLRGLFALAHPLESPARETAAETDREIGRREVVAALWRRTFPKDGSNISIPLGL